jgi:hypothetical protein
VSGSNQGTHLVTTYTEHINLPIEKAEKSLDHSANAANKNPGRQKSQGAAVTDWMLEPESFALPLVTGVMYTFSALYRSISECITRHSARTSEDYYCNISIYPDSGAVTLEMRDCK